MVYKDTGKEWNKNNKYRPKKFEIDTQEVDKEKKKREKSSSRRRSKRRRDNYYYDDEE